MPAKTIFDNKLVYQYYVVDGHTYDECARYFHTSRKTITAFIKDNGFVQSEDILARHRQRVSKLKVHIDKDKLYQLYIIDNKTKAEVADIFGVSESVISSRLSEFKICKDSNKRIENAKRNFCIKHPDGFKEANIQEKRKATCLAKYGCEHPAQSDDVKAKTKQTNKAKYGYECTLQSPDIRELSRQTNLAKYGCEHPMQDDAIKQKVKNTLIERYGVENISLLDKTRADKRRAMLADINPDNVDRIMDITKDRESFRVYISEHNFTTSKQIADDLGYSLCPVERLLYLYDSWDLMKYHKSYMELEIKNFLRSIGIETCSRRDLIAPYEIDMYNDEHKIGIEFNGTYWHSSLEKPKTYHEMKSKMCEKVGVRLIHIYEYEWADPIKQEIIKSLLRIAFGKTPSRIYARECEVREISNKEAKAFNDTNHLQGHKNAQVTFGLFYHDNLVQLMSFSYKKQKDWWEIERGCPGSNNIVIGGVSKLFKHFVKYYKPQRVFSYCDFNKFDGKGYEAIGMACIGYTGPDMKWVVDGHIVNRNPKNHKKLQTNSEAKIWGAGSKKYLWSSD